jgi:uncharacterized membrane protein YphA (DoxX/SURF4 family)
LLIFLFIGFIFQGEWSFIRLLVSIFGLAACIMVAVGFKARWSAIFLVLVLSVLNVFVNNFWSLHSAHHQRDFLKYDFFQTLCTCFSREYGSAQLTIASQPSSVASFFL